VSVQLIDILETATWLDDLGEQLIDGVEAELDAGGKRVVYEARDQLRAQGVSGNYLVHYPRSISSEVERFSTHLDLTVGPESDKKQGGMGPGVEFGSVNTGPKQHLFSAFDARVEGIFDRVGRVMVHGK
jgi:hypothetical protein